MEFCSLHPLDPLVVTAYARAVIGDEDAGIEPATRSWDDRVLTAARQGYRRALAGEESGARAARGEWVVSVSSGPG